jgi:hypothetical protein
MSCVLLGLKFIANQSRALRMVCSDLNSYNFRMPIMLSCSLFMKIPFRLNTGELLVNQRLPGDRTRRRAAFRFIGRGLTRMRADKKKKQGSTRAEVNLIFQSHFHLAPVCIF